MGKIMLFVALTAIYVLLPVQSSVIRTTDGVIYCDGMACPMGSTSCTVTKKTCEDLKFYNYIRLCADEFGVPTRTEECKLPNPLPGTNIDSVSSSYGSRPLTEEERMKLEADLGKMDQQMEKWKREFNENLNKQFPPGFPFN